MKSLKNLIIHSRSFI